jgi:excisionase family DNA binding protein
MATQWSVAIRKPLIGCGGRWLHPKTSGASPSLLTKVGKIGAAMLDDTLTYNEAAALLVVRPDYVRKLVQRGRLQAAPTVGNRGRVTRASVERYATERGQRTRKPFAELSERQQYRRKKDN